MSSNKTLSNQEIADLLREVSAVLEVKNRDRFRVRAYAVAADSIEKEGTSLYTIWKNNQLDDIPNIGEKMTRHLDQLFKTGTPTYLNNIKKQVPAGMFPLLKIEGVGPKTSYKLAKTFNLESEKNAFKETLKIAKQGKIREIRGLGEKLEERLIEVLSTENLQRETTEPERIRIDIAENISNDVLSYLKSHTDISQASALGSLRRKRPTIGDIDLGVATTNPEKIQAIIKEYPENSKTLSTGNAFIRFMHKTGYGVDIKIVSPLEWGSLLQHFTGSKSHNIALREFALKKNLSLSEYGIKNTKTGKTKQFSSEEDFYKELGLPWIPPEIRENVGELELAQKNTIPSLIELKDIKGDFHTHSNYDWKSSHDYGENTFEEIIKAAIAKNYKFIGIGDHNPSSFYNEVQLEKLFKKRAEIIENLRKKYPKITIYNSMEVNIRPDGSLAISQHLLKTFDYVVASVHSSLKSDRATMTNRVLKALEHQKVKILGHPTGKMLGKRASYELDWQKIFASCKKNNVALEVNASTNRLDIDEIIVKEAIKNKIKIAINTDAHAIKHLDFMKYGVYVASRGFATKNDCINCALQPI